MSEIVAKAYLLRTGQSILIRSALPSDAQQFQEMVRLMLEEGEFMILYTSLGFQEEGRLMKQVKMDDGRFIDLVLMRKFVKEAQY